MSGIINTTPPVADRFEVYYAEKLWQMIPPIYRLEDGLAANPNVLRSLVELIARQAALLRRSQDQVWDDAFIELCNDWAVPYIGELLGTRLVAASNARGRRVDVAKTIYYRRRKGTLRVLEELITDITGWNGKVVEEFKRLVRPRHGLDPAPSPYAGRLTGTMPGGVADLRKPNDSELSDSPFDEYYHTADFRQHRGLSGRYNLPKLGFHLYRLTAYKMVDVTPFDKGDGLSFGFDPSGRDIPLFNRNERGSSSVYNWEQWQSALEWELPCPIRCRLLGENSFEFTPAIIDAIGIAAGLTSQEDDDLRTLIAWTIVGETRLKETLADLPNGASFINPPNYTLLKAILREALVHNCGKYAMLPETLTVQVADLDEPFEEMSSGHLDGINYGPWDISALPLEKTMMIDPVQGRFAFVDLDARGEGELTAQYHYGFSGDIGAGPYDRRAVEDVQPDVTVSGGTEITSTELLDDGVLQINDNRTYNGMPNSSAVENMTVQAANQTRPYIRLRDNWTLDTGTNLNASLVLDGLWIGASSNYCIVLKGDYEKVVIRNCTFDPGGGRDLAGTLMGTVFLQIEGHVECLTIDHCILGPIMLMNGGDAENMTLSDSIVQSLTGDPALYMETTAGKLERVTVFGETLLHTIQAQEVLMTGHATITNTQTGCFRYSAVPKGSRVPRAYPYLLEDFTIATEWFTSIQFGDPGYGQLTEIVPQSIARGAENGSEIGAFASLLNPIKYDSLRIKVAEYMPFGLIPLFIFET